MPYIGSKNTFISGILLVSIFQIVFGFLPWIEDKTLFIVSCMACRVGMAIGSLAMQNAIFVIVALTWPDDVAFR